MRRGVEFEAHGKVRLLRYGTNALCRIETATGQGITEAAKRLQGDVSLSDLRLFWWAGLGDVTMDQAGDLMDEVGFDRAGELIGKAFTLAFPEAQGGASDGKKAMGTAA